MEPISVNAESGTQQPNSALPAPHYRHAAAPGAAHRRETMLTLALEAGVMGLGRQRVMPQGLYAQEKACKQVR